MPLSIISDRGTQFTSKFWDRMHEELQNQLTFSTTFCPQTNTQLKRTIQVLENIVIADFVDICN